jgi:hypothetical protein
MSSDENQNFESLEKPLTKHRKTLKNLRYTPYGDLLSTFLEQQLNNLVLWEDLSVRQFHHNQDSEFVFVPSPPTSPESPESPPFPSSPICSPIPDIPSSPVPSPSDSVSTLAAEYPPYFISSSNCSPQSTNCPSPNSPPTPTDSVVHPDDTDLPPEIVEFLYEQQSSIQSVPYSSIVEESEKRAISSKESEPHPEPNPPLEAAEPSTLPVLTAAETESELKLLSPCMQFSPPLCEQINSEQARSISPKSHSSTTEFNLPSILQIEVHPTDDLIQLLQRKSQQISRNKNQHFRKPNKKYYSSQWIQ